MTSHEILVLQLKRNCIARSKHQKRKKKKKLKPCVLQDRITESIIIITLDCLNIFKITKYHQIKVNKACSFQVRDILLKIQSQCHIIYYFYQFNLLSSYSKNTNTYILNHTYTHMHTYIMYLLVSGLTDSLRHWHI